MTSAVLSGTGMRPFIHKSLQMQKKGKGGKEDKKHPDKRYSLCTFINKIDDLQHVSVDSVLREFSNG